MKKHEEYLDLLFPTPNMWTSIRDGDPRAFRLFERHYSFHRYGDNRRDPNGFYRNRRKIVGPGEYQMLLTPAADALFVWRLFRSGDAQEGLNCAVFRNEGKHRSSDLILAAEYAALQKWPETKRFYTYVNPRKVRSCNPGYCFKMAGWQKCGTTKVNKLLILEKIINASLY